MDDTSIHQRISALVDAEHELRQRLQSGDIGSDDEKTQLRDLEVQLDQCWDLLRQRDALRSAGQDPSGAAVRPPTEVEGYQQ